MPLYGRDNWNPRLIVAQILVVNCAYYLQLGIFYVVFNALFGTVLSLDLIFQWEAVTFTDVPGWLAVINSMFVALLGSFSLLVVVERARKCFDFAFTLFFFHWCLVVAYSGFPMSWEWWLVYSASLAVMTLGGEQLCMRTELADISFGDTHGKGKEQSNENLREATSVV